MKLEESRARSGAETARTLDASRFIG
jgi:hypothetical protein